MEYCIIAKGDPNYSFDMFNNKINEVMDTYIPLKKLTKKDLKLQLKPWITPGIGNSIKRRDRLLRKYIKAKDVIKKEEIHVRYKTLRNQTVSIIRQSKKMYYQKFFTKNANDIKKTWKGIRNIINIRNSNKGQPTSMLIGKELSTDPTKIADGFNTFFSSIAKNLQSKIYFAGEDYTNYLNNLLNQRFLFESADSTEIILSINSFEVSKATGPLAFQLIY